MLLQRGRVVPGQAMYPIQQAYPSGMAVPQYGYLPQHAMYQQPPGAYPGNGSAYAPARGYHQQQQQQQQPPAAAGAARLQLPGQYMPRQTHLRGSVSSLPAYAPADTSGLSFLGPGAAARQTQAVLCANR